MEFIINELTAFFRSKTAKQIIEKLGYEVDLPVSDSGRYFLKIDNSKDLEELRDKLEDYINEQEDYAKIDTEIVELFDFIYEHTF